MPKIKVSFVMFSIPAYISFKQLTSHKTSHLIMAAHISEGKQRELGFAAQRIDSNYPQVPLEAPLVVHIWLKNSCTKEFKIPQRYRDAGAFS